MYRVNGGYWGIHLHKNTKGNGADWEQELEYEKNVAVIYAGNPYVSRKNVPRNVEITNNEYWCKIDNLNSTVQLLQDTVDEYKKQGDEINSKYENLENALKTFTDKEKQVISFNSMKKEGETDDDVLSKIVTLINSNPDISYKINFDVNEMFLTKIVWIKRGNLILDFCNCLVHWENYEEVSEHAGDWRDVAIFNFAGTEDTNLTNVNWFNGSNTSNSSFSYTGNDFKEGDYVELRLGVNNKNGTADSVIMPYIYRMTRVISSIGNNVEVQYKQPWTQLENNLVNQSCIRHCKPVENVIIQNLNFIDDTVLDNAIKDENIQYAGRDKNNLVSFAYFRICANISISNCHCKYNTYPFMQFFNCFNINANNLSILQPKIIGGGEGYLFQVMQSTVGYFSNLIGLGERHLIDFTESSDMVVEHCTSNNSQQKVYGSFCQHGAYEHDIIYKDCVGTWNISYSGVEFGNACKNITLNNCRGWTVIAYSENLLLENCELYNNSFGTTNSKIINCKLHPWKDDGNFYIIPCQVRQEKRSCTIIHSEISGTLGQNKASIEHWDEINFIDTKIDLKDSSDSGNGTFSRFKLNDVNKLNFIDCNITSQFINYNMMKNCNMNISFAQCKFYPSATDGTGILELMGMVDNNSNTINVIFRSCEFYPSIDNQTIIRSNGSLIDHDGYVKNDDSNEINISMIGNIMSDTSDKKLKIVVDKLEKQNLTIAYNLFNNCVLLCPGVTCNGYESNIIFSK